MGHPLRWALLSELALRDRHVPELTALAGQPRSLVSYHLGRLCAGKLVPHWSIADPAREGGDAGSYPALQGTADDLRSRFSFPLRVIIDRFPR